MSSRAFDKPVYLKDGKYLVREIASLHDAIEFLNEWPERRRDLVHEVALRTCLMAHDGHKPLHVARDAIRAFGKKMGILEKAPAVEPWMIKKTSGDSATA